MHGSTIQVFIENEHHAIHSDTHSCCRHRGHYLGPSSRFLSRRKVLDLAGLPRISDRVRSDALLVNRTLFDDLQAHVKSLGRMG